MDMKVRTWRVMQDCIDRGIVSGVNKWVKWSCVELTDAQRQSLVDLIGNYIGVEVDEWFVVREESDD